MIVPPPPPAVSGDSSIKSLNKRKDRKCANDIYWIAGEIRKGMGRLEDRVTTTLEVFGARLDNLELQSRITQQSQAAMYERHINSDALESGLILVETSAAHSYFEWNVEMPEFIPVGHWETLQQDDTQNNRECQDSAAINIFETLARSHSKKTIWRNKGDDTSRSRKLASRTDSRASDLEDEYHGEQINDH